MMPLPCFSSLVITDLTTCSGLRILKSNESKSVEKMPMLRSPTYLSSLRRMPQRRETEERTDRLVAERDADRRDAFFDFVLAFLLAQPRQVLVRPGVRTDGVAGRRDLLHDFRMPAGVLADREEHRLGALIGERLEHGRRVARPRAVIESEHDLVVAQEVISLEMLEAEARAAGGVNLHDARNAEGIRVVTFGRSGRWRCRRSWCRDALGAGAGAF